MAACTRVSAGCRASSASNRRLYLPRSLRFDNKAQFARYLSEATEGIASMSFGFRQPSYRVFNGSTGIMNAYDSFFGVTKDGKAQTLHGRTTLVFVKQGGKWMIVSAHFSSLPHTP